MKTIYKSCYFSTVTPFSILAQNTVNGTVLTISQNSPFRVNVICTRLLMVFQQILMENFNSNVKMLYSLLLDIKILLYLQRSKSYTGGR
jgi:hypothetical protein